MPQDKLHQDKASKSLPKTIVVQLDSGPVDVKKLPLGKYALLLQELQKLPEILEKLTSFESDEILQQLPSMLATSWSDIIGIMSIATGVDKKELEEDIGLDEGISLVTAVIEVNDFFAVAQNLGNLKEVWREKSTQYNQTQLIKAMGKTGSRK